MSLEAYFLFVKREQQQNAPACQQAGVLQEEHHPGSLVVDVDQGGKLNRREDKSQEHLSERQL